MSLCYYIVINSIFLFSANGGGEWLIVFQLLDLVFPKCFQGQWQFRDKWFRGIFEQLGIPFLLFEQLGITLVRAQYFWRITGSGFKVLDTGPRLQVWFAPAYRQIVCWYTLWYQEGGKKRRRRGGRGVSDGQAGWQRRATWAMEGQANGSRYWVSWGRWGLRGMGFNDNWKE